MILAFHDYSLEPKITLGRDPLYLAVIRYLTANRLAFLPIIILTKKRPVDLDVDIEALAREPGMKNDVKVIFK